MLIHLHVLFLDSNDEYTYRQIATHCKSVVAFLALENPLIRLRFRSRCLGLRGTRIMVQNGLAGADGCWVLSSVSGGHAVELL